METATNNGTQFRTLLNEAITKPGTMMAAYSLFWNYSLGNQILAMMQAEARGIKPGPIASFNKWKELGRFVKKGEKAIELCMPITGKRTVTEEDANGNKTEKEVRFIIRFDMKRNWFMLPQTDGAQYEAPAIPGWDRARALAELKIEETPFDLMNGNCQGYAKGRSIAISPIAAMPHKTTFHEIAHIELGHTEVSIHDSETLPRNLKEVEAEGVALLCCEALGLDGAEFSRGYIQHWLDGANEIPESSAQRIFRAADKILKAGVDKKAAAEA